MKALIKYGKEYGGYRFQEVPEPVCGNEDIIIKIKAAAICGTDLKHFGIENGSNEYDSIRGHEFAGEIVEVGKDVTDWKVGQRVVSDNMGHACGVCPACQEGQFLTCSNKIGLGLGLDGGFTKLVKIPGDILRLHKHAIWEIPENVSYEEASILDPICNAYKAVAQRSALLPGENVVVFGTGAIGLFTIQMCKIMGAINIIAVGLDDDVGVRFDTAMKLGATHVINGSREDVVTRAHEICGKEGIMLVVDCAGATPVLKQAIDIVRNNGQVVKIGTSTKPLNYSINDISLKAVSIIGHMGYDTVSWRNGIALLAAGKIDAKSLITYRLPLSKWEEGFKLMATRKAIKVVFHYDGDDPDDMK